MSQVIQDIGGLESFNVNIGMDKRGALSGLDLYFALSVPGTGGKVRFIGTGSPGIGESAATDYYGTAQKIEYRVTPKVFVEASRSYGQSGNSIQAPICRNLQKHGVSACPTKNASIPGISSGNALSRHPTRRNKSSRFL